MIGQLYYYDSQITSSVESINKGDINNVDILGVETADLEEVSQLSASERKRRVRDLFINNYSQYLVEEKMFRASQVWSNLVSPTDMDSDKFSNQPFIRTIAEWMKEGSKFSELEEVVKYSFDVDSDDEFALYYGLKVVHELSKVTETDTEDIEQDAEDKDGEYSADPEMLVVCQSHLAPLFINLNSEYQALAQDRDDNLSNIKAKLEANKSIKLILVISPEYLETVEYLDKRLDSEYVVSGIDLDGNDSGSSDTFFDKLARKTLGMRI